MTSSLERLRHERQRKLQVREAFRSGLAKYRKGEVNLTTFLMACGDYLLVQHERLNAQDQCLVDLLRKRVPAHQRENHQLMDTLIERLQKSGIETAKFKKAVGAFHQSSDAGVDAFAAASDDFLHLLTHVLGARSHSLRDLTSSLLDESDWAVIADLTDEALDLEKELLKKISEVAPDGLDPPAFSTAPPVSQ